MLAGFYNVWGRLLVKVVVRCWQCGFFNPESWSRQSIVKHFLITYTRQSKCKILLKIKLFTAYICPHIPNVHEEN